jgi:Mucin-2 protein WxxW repeating region
MDPAAKPPLQPQALLAWMRAMTTAHGLLDGATPREWDASSADHGNQTRIDPGIQAPPACGQTVLQSDTCISYPIRTTGRVCADGQSEYVYLRMERRYFAGGGRETLRLPETQGVLSCGIRPPDPDCFSTCSTGVQWSRWYDDDSPTGLGDFEGVDNSQANTFTSCAFPVAAQCESEDGLAWYQTGEWLSFAEPHTCQCLNSQQPDARCRNYKIRYQCPAR